MNNIPCFPCSISPVMLCRSVLTYQGMAQENSLFLTSQLSQYHSKGTIKECPKAENINKKQYKLGYNLFLKQCRSRSTGFPADHDLQCSCSSCFLFVLMLYVNNFSAIFGQFPVFLGLNQYYAEDKVSCSKTQPRASIESLMSRLTLYH